MDRGDLVPDDVILGIMKEALAQPQLRARARCSTASCARRRRPRACERVLARARPASSTRCSCSTSTTRRSCSGSAAARCASKCQTPYTGREPGDVPATKCGGDARAPQGRRARGGPQPPRGVPATDGARARLVPGERAPSVVTDRRGRLGGRRHAARAERASLGGTSDVIQLKSPREIEIDGARAGRSSPPRVEHAARGGAPGHVDRRARRDRRGRSSAATRARRRRSRGCTAFPGSVCIVDQRGDRARHPVDEARARRTATSSRSTSA